MTSAVLLYGGFVSFYIKRCRVTVDFSFILILSFALLLEVDNIIYLILFSILHELGHLLSLKICGGNADSLTLSFYGLALKYSNTLSRNKELIIIASGPMVNLLLYLVLRDNINLALFVLNMLPIFPLDGGRLVMLFSYKLSVALSRVFTILIFVVSIIMVVKYKSFSLLLISIYLVAYSIMY